MDEDEEDEMVAEAAAAAAAAGAAARPPHRPGSLLEQSSSFRPHMHVRMQALSARRHGSFLSSRAGLTVGPAGGGVGDLPAEMASIAHSIVASRFSRSTRERDLQQELGPEGTSAPQEALNEKAVKVIRRVQDKLSGLEFGDGDEPPYKVKAQVDLLIKQATSNERLCQCFIGWCPFW
ncbi:unnamed protein product [Ectocarpus sp. 12 AP-2014]